MREGSLVKYDYMYHSNMIGLVLESTFSGFKVLWSGDNISYILIHSHLEYNSFTILGEC